MRNVAHEARATGEAIPVTLCLDGGRLADAREGFGRGVARVHDGDGRNRANVPHHMREPRHEARRHRDRHALARELGGGGTDSVHIGEHRGRGRILVPAVGGGGGVLGERELHLRGAGVEPRLRRLRRRHRPHRPLRAARAAA